MGIDGNIVAISWNALFSTPFHAPAAGSADPYTNPGSGSFFLAFELYTTGHGQQWARYRSLIEESDTRTFAWEKAACRA